MNHSIGNYCTLYNTGQDDALSCSIEVRPLEQDSTFSKNYIEDKYVGTIKNYVPSYGNCTSFNVKLRENGTKSIDDIKYELEASSLEYADIYNFISLVDIDCLESGIVSDAEKFLHSLYETKGNSYVLGLALLIIERSEAKELEKTVMIDCLSGFDYLKLGKTATEICKLAFKNSSQQTKEYIINACETWEDYELLSYLKSHETELSKTLKEELNQIVAEGF